MIHEIGVELQARLAARGVPFVVVDGPERTRSSTFGRERIVIENDGGDTFGPSHVKGTNPLTVMTRSQAVKITIYAQSPLPGAREFEHRRRADKALDHVLVSLIQIASARKNTIALKSGQFISSGDLEKSESVGGAVYELRLTFDRGVIDTKWDGSKRPEASDYAFKKTTKVSLHGGADDDDDPSTIPTSAETACSDE